jgi:hypothetical protein
LATLMVAAACSDSSARASSPSASTTTPRAALTARQRASVCTAADLSVNNVSVPGYRRLTSPRTAWFGRVRLDPVPSSVQPHVALDTAWSAFGSGPTPTSSELGFSGSVYGSAVYDVVLAYWTSNGDIVVHQNGQPLAHDRVLAWVAMGTHLPVRAPDVDSQRLTVPGVPCYFGVGITAVNATTGQLLSDALDYH